MAGCIAAMKEIIIASRSDLTLLECQREDLLITMVEPGASRFPQGVVNNVLVVRVHDVEDQPSGNGPRFAQMVMWQADMIVTEVARNWRGRLIVACETGQRLAPAVAAAIAVASGLDDRAKELRSTYKGMNMHVHQIVLLAMGAQKGKS